MDWETIATAVSQAWKKLDIATGLKVVLSGAGAYGTKYYYKKLPGIKKQFREYRDCAKNVALLEVKLATMAIELDAVKDELHNEQGKLMSMFHTAPDPAFILDEVAAMKYANPAMVTMCNYRDPEALYGYRFLDLVAEGSKRHFVNMQKELEKGKAKNFQGKIEWVQDGTGNVVSTYCVTDITHNRTNGKVVEIIVRLRIL